MLAITKGTTSKLTVEGYFPQNPADLSFEKIFRDAVFQGEPTSVSTVFGLPASDDEFDVLVQGRAPIQSRSYFERYFSYQDYTSRILNFAENFGGTYEDAAMRNEHPVHHVGLRGCVREGTNDPLLSAGAWEQEEVRVRMTSFVIRERHPSLENYLEGRYAPVTIPMGRMLLSEAWEYMHGASYENSVLWSSSAAHVRIGMLRFDGMVMGNRATNKHVLYYVLPPSGGRWYHAAIIRNEVWYLELLPGPYVIDLPYEIHQAFRLRRLVGYYAYGLNVTSPDGTPAFNASMQNLYNTTGPIMGSTMPAPYTLYQNVITGNTWSASSVSSGATEDLIGWDGQRFWNTSPSTFRAYEELHSSLRLDIHNTGCLAAWSAINKASGQLGINQLESAREFWGVLALVDVVKLMQQAVKGATGGPGLLIWTIFDLLADARLLYSYGLAPSYDDCLVVADRAKDVATKWRSFCQHGTFYGSAVVEDTAFGLGTCIVRSKVRLGIQADSLLSVVPVYASGFLPTLSSLWELIPFTFLTDKLFPVGKAASWGENTFFLQCFDISYVTLTYLCRRCFSDAELAERGILRNTECTAGTDESGLEYRIFDRCTLSHAPYPGPSRLLSSELNSQVLNFDWLTTGSLSYRLLRR